MMAWRDAQSFCLEASGATGGASVRWSGGRDAGRLPTSRPASAKRAEGPPARFDNPAGAPLASLAGGALARRFRAWRGASGRRYVTTVYEASDDSWRDIEAAVILLVAVAPGDARRLVAAFPDADAARRARLVRTPGGAGEGCEIHLHLLADTPQARSAAVIDLLAGANCDAREPPASAAAR